MGCPRPNTPRSDPHDLGQLEQDLCDRLFTLFHDAPRRGLALVSGYRDPARQWDIRAERVGAEHACDPRYKAHPATAIPATWNGAAWVGGSDHQRRTAADIGGRDLQWAIDNRARYGIGLTVLSENWHNQAHGTDRRTGRAIGQPTVRILQYPGSRYDDATRPTMVRHWIGFDAGATDRSIATAGGQLHQVAEVQLILDALARRWHAPALDPGDIDGSYGPNTVRAIRAFKQRIISVQRAAGQKTWPNADPYVGAATVAMLRFWNRQS